MANLKEKQTIIEHALREAGATVQSLAACGPGMPHLLVGHNGVNYLLAIRDKGKAGKQVDAWGEQWKGAPVHTVGDADEAVDAVTRKLFTPTDQNDRGEFYKGIGYYAPVVSDGEAEPQDDIVLNDAEQG